ncbi:porin [Hyalangium rubrum]|uniref:Porin n=1 Tax=Hyalangium rubrum TaxID=3103134 RepID=A0ABU5H8Y0_9BACT|nr:porin [Hyalangium sp. s54d21]MDY7229582.1 porin [Hyalangium sp. s54d21]
MTSLLRCPSLWGVLLATLLLTGRPARAQEPALTPSDAPAPPDTEPPASEPATPATDDAPLTLSTALGSVEVGGRMSVRETLEVPQGGAWAGELTVPAARLEFTYKWKKRLRAVVEFDAAQGELKDAFAWLKVTKGLSVRAGRFKVPLSLVELESTRSLPLVRRGLLRDVLNSALGFTGRSTGAQLEWKCAGCTQDLKLRAGVWQTRDTDKKIALDKGLGLVPALRGTWASGNWEVGASALLQPAGANSNSDHHSWMSGLDVQHTLPLSQGGLRTWAEVHAGRATFLTGTEGPLLTGRAVTAWRWGGTSAGGAYVEPFAMLSALDPDLDRSSDLLWEGALGLNAGQWDLWRVQAQFEVRKAGAEVPASLLALDEDLASRRALLVQLQVNF